MIGREKVIKGLECCKETCGLGDCPYWNGSITDGSCMIKLQADALSLLKEQEDQIERLEYDLAVTQNNLNYYVNGND